MMSPLDPQCAAFVKAMNSHAPDEVVACFVEDAVVQDEGGTHRGHEEIRAWIAGAFAKYQPVLEVTGVTREGEQAVITGPVSGTFDGSPVVLRYDLTFSGGLIVTLKCEAA